MMLAASMPFGRKKRARELLDSVDLSEHYYKRPAQLSGGQQQRVAIAVALANQPKLLLADEPTGALDSQNSRGVMNLLMDLREKHGLTVLMVTHNMEVAAYADRVLTLRDGALAQDMSGDEAEGPKIDTEGRIQLPINAQPRLKEAARISVEVRPEGVLLRPEAEESDNMEALLQGILPQDAPPEKRNIFSRLLRRNRKKEKSK
jgi:ABC-type methionine transport system ATPase subunit